LLELAVLGLALALALASAAPVTHLEFAMNIELDEVVQDVSDDALELATGGAQGGYMLICTEN